MNFTVDQNNQPALVMFYPLNLEIKDWLWPFLSTSPTVLWQLLHLQLTLTCFQRQIAYYFSKANKAGSNSLTILFIFLKYFLCVYMCLETFKIFLRYNSYSTKFTHFECKLWWVVISVNIFVSIIPIIVQNIFITRKFPNAFLLSIFLHVWLWATTNLLHISID